MGGNAENNRKHKLKIAIQVLSAIKVEYPDDDFIQKLIADAFSVIFEPRDPVKKAERIGNKEYVSQMTKPGEESE